MGKRTLLCEQSQVTLRHRRFEFANGTRFYALDKGRELHSGYQMNPEAFETVRDDALARSYARATELSFYRARTKLSRRAVGSILREAAETLKKTGSQAARGLFELGLAADVEAGAKAPCMIADDAWLVPQRDPMGRISTGASGSVCTTLLSRSPAFWRSGVARVGSLCDLSALEIVRLSTDGEGWREGESTNFRSRPTRRDARGARRTTPTRRAKSPSLHPASPTTPLSSVCRSRPRHHRGRQRHHPQEEACRPSVSRARAYQPQHLCGRYRRRI